MVRALERVFSATSGSTTFGSAAWPSFPSVVPYAIPCRVPLVVLDTNVLVSAIRSRRGASFRILELVGTGAFDIAVSVPLVFEYEDALLRHIEATALGRSDIEAIIDYVCAESQHQNIFYLWRPLLRDPKDDMIAELAVAAGCDAIVTHNVRDFSEIGRFGVRVFKPGDFLKKLGV